jgi:hypothetical protein
VRDDDDDDNVDDDVDVDDDADADEEECDDDAHVGSVMLVRIPNVFSDEVDVRNVRYLEALAEALTSDVVECARACEAAVEKRAVAEKKLKETLVIARDAQANADEALMAKSVALEDVSRRMLALLNEKKRELLRKEETLESARAEIEALEARLERMKNKAHETRGSEDEFDRDEYEDATAYTTDEDVDLTRKDGGETQTQTPQSSKKRRASTTSTRTTKPSPTKKKAFLASTLELLNTE